MIRSIFILALASALCAACSRESAPQPGAADKAPAAVSTPAPAAAAPTTAQPSASGTPTATSPAPTSGQAQPESALPQASAPSAAPSSTAAAAEPSAPPAPKFREVTIPAETPISVRLVTPVASNTSKVEDQIRGRLAKPIIVSGTTVVPAGSEVIGSIIEATESGRVKGRALVAFRFDRLNVGAESHRIRTARIAREAESSTKSDVKKGAVGAGVGAVVGGIAGGGSGAAIGAGVGGAGAVLATKGKEVELAAGTTLSTRLLEPVKVRLKVGS